jgi:hypothetical protein
MEVRIDTKDNSKGDTIFINEEKEINAEMHNHLQKSTAMKLIQLTNSEQ